MFIPRTSFSLKDLRRQLSISVHRSRVSKTTTVAPRCSRQHDAEAVARGEDSVRHLARRSTRPSCSIPAARREEVRGSAVKIDIRRPTAARSLS